jgi:hypothetical protein
MKQNRILRLITDSACPAQKLFELKKARWELPNYQVHSAVLLDVSCRRKIKSSSLTFIYNEYRISLSLLSCENS